MGTTARVQMTDIEYQMLKTERKKRELYRKLKEDRKNILPIGSKSRNPRDEEKIKAEALKLKEFIKLAESLGL